MTVDIVGKSVLSLSLSCSFPFVCRLLLLCILSRSLFFLDTFFIAVFSSASADGVITGLSPLATIRVKHYIAELLAYLDNRRFASMPVDDYNQVIIDAWYNRDRLAVVRMWLKRWALWGDRDTVLQTDEVVDVDMPIIGCVEGTGCALRLASLVAGLSGMADKDICQNYALSNTASLIIDTARLISKIWS